MLRYDKKLIKSLTIFKILFKRFTNPCNKLLSENFVYEKLSGNSRSTAREILAVLLARTMRE